MNWIYGPDKLMEASSYIATKLSDAVKIRSNVNNAKLMQPISIYSMFHQVVAKVPNHIALGYIFFKIFILSLKLF